MTNQGDNDNSQDCDDRRRVDVELLIVHPSIEPNAVSNALQLVAHYSHRVGDPRVTPDGRALTGQTSDSRWRHNTRHVFRDQWFSDAVTAFVDQLMPYKAFLEQLRGTGGRASLIIQFLGDGYHGDALSTDILSKIVHLGLDLEIEVFNVQQRE